MRLVVVGNEEECLGFSLAGVEGVVVKDEQAFLEKMSMLLKDEEVGVISVVDCYFDLFASHYSDRIARHPIPAVVFIPSLDGIHHEASLKEYLASILGIEL